MNEIETIDYLKQNYFPNLKKSTDEFSHFDCYSLDEMVVIEIKNRSKHYDTIIFERIKYVNLLKIYLEKDLKPLYVVTTPKGVFCWDISKQKFDWIINQINPKSTYFKNKNQKATKWFSYLEIKKSKKI